MSFHSSPAFRRFLSAPVPVLLYGLLAVASAVGLSEHKDDLFTDEDESGPIFQQVARRTRRNSGMGSAIWRPPDTIANVTHDYY